MYDQTHFSMQNPTSIAIDSAGYLLVVNYHSNSLAIIDPSGEFVRSIEGFGNPYGVSLIQYHLMDQYGWLILKMKDL